MTGHRPRILIVEDHELLASSLAAVLGADGYEVMRPASPEAGAVIATARDEHPDVVLLDLGLGGHGSGLDLIPHLLETGASVVMMTGETDRQRLAECVEAGAIGVVHKSEPFDVLVDAIKETAELGSLLTAHQREALLAELRHQRAADRVLREGLDRLTAKEREVLMALIDGHSAEAIAQRAVVSLATTRTHIRSILSKLGVSSQLAAVALARRAGWSG